MARELGAELKKPRIRYDAPAGQGIATIRDVNETCRLGNARCADIHADGMRMLGPFGHMGNREDDRTK